MDENKETFFSTFIKVMKEHKGTFTFVTITGMIMGALILTIVVHLFDFDLRSAFKGKPSSSSSST